MSRVSNAEKALRALRGHIAAGFIASRETADALESASIAISAAILSESAAAEAGFHLRGCHIHATIGDDGAVVVWIDTEDEPTPQTLRVNVNDGGVYGYPDETSADDSKHDLAAALLGLVQYVTYDEEGDLSRGEFDARYNAAIAALAKAGAA